MELKIDEMLSNIECNTVIGGQVPEQWEYAAIEIIKTTCSDLHAIAAEVEANRARIEKLEGSFNDSEVARLKRAHELLRSEQEKIRERQRAPMSMFKGDEEFADPAPSCDTCDKNVTGNHEECEDRWCSPPEVPGYRPKPAPRSEQREDIRDDEPGNIAYGEGTPCPSCGTLKPKWIIDEIMGSRKELDQTIIAEQKAALDRATWLIITLKRVITGGSPHCDREHVVAHCNEFIRRHGGE